MGLDDPLDPPCSHCGATVIVDCECHWDHPKDPVASLANSSAWCAKLLDRAELAEAQLANAKTIIESLQGDLSLLYAQTRKQLASVEAQRDHADKLLAEMTAHRDAWAVRAETCENRFFQSLNGELPNPADLGPLPDERLPWEGGD